MASFLDRRVIFLAGAVIGLGTAPFLGLPTPGSLWVPFAAATVLIGVLVRADVRVDPVGPFLLLACALILGLFAGAARLAAIDSGALRASSGEISLSGFLSGPPRRSGNGWRLPVETGDGRLAVESGRLPPGLSTGDGLEFTGQVRRPPIWLAGYLRTQGIGIVVEAERVVVDGRSRDGIPGLLDRIRSRAEEALAAGIGPVESSLAKGFVLGQDQEIPEQVVDDFRDSGLAHLLAVSGQNVVLLCLLGSAVMGVVGVRRRWRVPILALLVLLYVPLAGAGPSIQRAGVMGIAGLAAVWAGRRAMRLWVILLAAGLTLVLNPRFVEDPGWQLSFAAVVGIMLLARPLADRLRQVRSPLGPMPEALSEGLAVTFAATVATLPLIALNFGRLPMATMAANLLVLPAVAPSMWLGMASAVVGQVDPSLSIPLNLLNAICLGFIERVAGFMGGPGSVLEIGTGPVTTLGAVCTTFLIGSSVLLLRPSRLAVLLVLLTAVPILMLPGSGRRSLPDPPPGAIRVDYLDIGQGDAILLRAPGNDPVLVDTGPPDGGIVEALESAGVDRLGAVFLTHLDLDHSGGLLDVVDRFEVASVGHEGLTPEFVAALRAEGATASRLVRGDRFGFGPGKVEVLWPDSTQSAPDRNAGSLVMRVSVGGHSTLLTADAEAEAVPLDPGPVDVLKVAHHGSADSGLPTLLDRTEPALAILSCGEGNRYGHPDPSTLTALGQAGVSYLRTDRDGTISVLLSASGVTAESGH